MSTTAGSVSLVAPSDGSLATAAPVSFVADVADENGLASAGLYLANLAGTVEQVEVSGSARVDDAQITADSPTTAAGGALAVNVDGATPHAHGLIKVPDLIGVAAGQVPPGAHVVSATLQFNCINPGNAMSAYLLLEDWTESEATWNQRAAGVAWSVPGADGGPAHDPLALPSDGTATGWRSVDITPFVQAWALGAANCGLVLKDGGTDGVDFDSSETTSGPVLTVYYLPLVENETKFLSGLSQTVTFGPVSLSDGASYVWNCRLEDPTGEVTWAPASAEFLVDSHFPAIPGVVAPLDQATQAPLSVDLQVSVSDPDPGDSLDVRFYGRAVGTAGEEFTIAVLPDTQKYTTSAALAPIFTKQTQWIVDNRESGNIVFVCHEGDVADDPNSTTQYDFADGSLTVFDLAGMPYGLLPGNHDIPTGLFNQHFPYTRYDSESWYGGHYPATGNDNSYQLISAGGIDLIVLHLQFWPGSGVITWADSVLKAHPNRKAIIVTHGFLGLDGSRSVHVMGSTQYIWDGLVVPNPNVFFVLCGHVHGEVARTDVVAGRPVHQLLADYQSDPNGGNGWMRLMRFVPAENRVYVRTYSPYLGAYETDADSEFQLDFAMEPPFELVGSALDQASGSTPAVHWSGLGAATAYEWYASVTDTTDRQSMSPVWRFSTISDDTQPPVITDGPLADPVSDTSATIVWATDEASDSTVEYRPAGGTALIAQDTALVIDHRIVLTDLTAGTDHEYRVLSTDASGNTGESGWTPFTTRMPPVAEDQSVSTDEDTPVAITLTGTGGSLTFTILQQPEHGTLAGTPPSVTYTPALNYHGPDGFWFIANDGYLDSDPAPVSLTVLAVNDAPEPPGNLQAEAGANIVTLTWDPAFDADGDGLTYVVHRGLTSGSYDMIADPISNLTFVDDTAVNGTTYYYAVEAVDPAAASSGLSDEVSATPAEPLIEARAETDPVVTVGGLGGAGVGGTWAPDDGSVQTLSESPTGPAGASGLDAVYTLVASSVPTTVAQVDLQLVANWTNSDSNDPLQVFIWNGAGWEDITTDILDGLWSVGQDADTYVSSSGELRVRFTDSGSIRKESKDTLTIDLLVARLSGESGPPPPNTAPTAVDDSASTAVDQSVTIDVLANDTDPEGDGLVVADHDLQSVGGGSVAPNGNGTLTYTPPTGYEGTDSFTYGISDGDLLAPAPATVTVTVSATPPPAEMHVAELLVDAYQVGKKWKAEARVTVHTSDDSPVMGATVVGRFLLNGVEFQTGVSAVTDASGVAIPASSPVKADSGGGFMFELTTVTHPDYVYVP